MSFKILRIIKQFMTSNMNSPPIQPLKISFQFHYSERWVKTLKRSVICMSSLGLCLFLYRQQTLCEKATDFTSENENLLNKNYDEAIYKCRDVILQLKDEVGIPGVAIGVTVNGALVWEEGFGYSDIENRVKCSPNTVMRIASISKSITMAAVSKLWEDNKLDLEKPVQYYVPDFPQKKINGEQVQITCRQLLSHLAGIRHYSKNTGKANSSEEKAGDLKKKSCKLKDENVKEFEFKEYYIKEKYDDVKSALSLFKDDELIAKPGSKYHYSTHGWTLISAIVEKVSNESFTNHMTKLFKDLGLVHTSLDVNDTLIYYRSRYYVKNKQGCIINAPYVDNSYKWAGGGFLSTVGDLLSFGNIMLYSLQFRPISENVSIDLNLSEDKMINDTEHILNVPYIQKHSGFLKANTVKTIWTPVTKTTNKDWMYGMGWAVLPEKHICEYCMIQPFAVAHTGGAIGASSVLLILPKKCDKGNPMDCEWEVPPKGVVVAILANLQEVALNKKALEIAKIFNNV